MTITPTLLTHGRQTGTFTTASTDAINAASGSKILLAFAYRSDDLAAVTNEVPIVSGAAQYWGPLERRLFDTSNRMHAHLYQGYGEFTNEPVTITTFLSRSLDGLYWAAIQVAADGTPYVIRTSNNANSTTTITASFLEPYEESTNTVITMALTDYFGNADWTSSVHFPNILLETSSAQYSAHIAYSTASVESPMIATNAVEKVLFGVEVKEIAYTPYIQGRYIKLQAPTASATNHYDTIDITEGTNRKIVAQVAMQQSFTVTQMSFNSTPMLSESRAFSNVGDSKIQSWYFDIADELPTGSYPVTMSAAAPRQPYSAHWYQLTNAVFGAPMYAERKIDSVGANTMRGVWSTGSLDGYGIGIATTSQTASYMFSGMLPNEVQYGGNGGNYIAGTTYGHVWSNNITKFENLFSITNGFQASSVMIFAPAYQPIPFTGRAGYNSGINTNVITFSSLPTTGVRFTLEPQS